MADRTLTAELRIGASDNTGGVLGAIARKIEGLSRASSRVSAAGSRLNGVGGRVEGAGPGVRRAERASAAGAGVPRAGGGGAGAGLVAAGVLGGYGPAAGATAGAYAAARAFKDFAEAERAVTRSVVTADGAVSDIQPTLRSIQRLAIDTAQPFEKVAEGFDSLVAQGRSLKESMDFLPSVARTAQAAGAEVSDIAKTADAVGSNFKITGAEMQRAFDIMAAGGKAGQFELKDMARYLPSLGPAAAALGFKGEQGLADLVSMLQTMRKGSGTAEEAVSSMNNILSKMEADKITKAFKDVGIDSKKEFEKARKEGRNLVEVFEELITKATKGDVSKIGDFIDDMEFKRGALALMSFKGEWQKLSASLRATAGGTVAKDFAVIMGNTQANLDRAAASAKRFGVTLGGLMAPSITTALDDITAALERFDAATSRAKEAGNRYEKQAPEEREAERNRFYNRWLLGEYSPQSAADVTARRRLEQAVREGIAREQVLNREAGQARDAARTARVAADTAAPDAAAAKRALDALPRDARGGVRPDKVGEAQRLNEVVKRGAGLEAAAAAAEAAAARAEAARDRLTAALEGMDAVARRKLDAERALDGARAAGRRFEAPPVDPSGVNGGIGGGDPSRRGFGFMPNGPGLPHVGSGFGAPKASPVPVPGARPADLPPGGLLGIGRLEPVLSALQGQLGKPIDVTGKVDAEVKGAADVRVQVQVVGDGRVTGLSASGTGHVRASVGANLSGKAATFNPEGR